MPTATSPTKVLLSASPVPYKILRSKPATIDGDPGGWRLALSVSVDAADVITFCSWAAGLPYTVDLGGGVTANRVIPLSDPFVGRFLCTGIRAEYVGGYTPTNPDPVKQWSSGKVDLEFSSVPYPTDGAQPFMTVEIEDGVEVYTVGGMAYKFASGEPIQADAGVKVPTAVYSVTIFNCADSGESVVLPILGKLNNAVFQGRAVGTVRCDGFAARITVLAGGQTTYERSLKLTWRPVHWNYFLNRSGVWGLVTDPSSNPVYALTDFSPLVG